MKNIFTQIAKAALALTIGLNLGLTALPAHAKGGSGGGGGTVTTPVFESRVTGYITAINYVNKTITVGASYYGNGSLKVDSTTKISMNTVNCDFEAVKLGDWMEARYDWTTKIATKLSGTATVTP